MHAQNTAGYDAPIGLTADPVVFTLVDGRLSVLLARRLEEPQRGMFALPGGFVGTDEAPEQTAERKLREKTGVGSVHLEQLRTGDHSFESLRLVLGIRRRDLEAEIRHAERTARRAGERLVVTPAECEACGFVFRGRDARHLQPPSRCPKCRSERIVDPLFRLEGE